MFGSQFWTKTCAFKKGYKIFGGKIGGNFQACPKISFIFKIMQQVLESPKRTIPSSQNVLKP